MYLITGFILLLNLNFVNLATTICYVKKASVRQVFHSLEEGRHVSLVLFVALAFLFIFTVRQYIREADREWEVQPRKFRRALDMSSEPVFVAALSKLTIRFSSLFPHSPSSSFPLLLHIRFLGLLVVCKITIIIVQFRESGCDNCSFFKMDEDHECVVDCTTPNLTGQARHPLLFSFSYNLNNTSSF